MSKAKGSKQRIGERLVTEFSELRDALRKREPIEKKYTVRTVELELKPKSFDAESVRLIRLSLGVSQAVFAHLLGVSVDSVAAWEQGNRAPNGPVCRLLELMEIDRGRWLRMLEQTTRKAEHESKSKAERH